ncbi:MAG: hypothetical protein QOG05_5406 [Streptosporangiaceae bacterium]|nr:hypothetical protein [Streptosporangiaceae bacterium]
MRARRGRTAPRWRLADLSLEDRITRGRAARRESPRSGHARWEPAPGRPDPVTLLEDQAATRVPELVPIRYGRMLVSPGTFYRGGALIMASDLAATPRSGVTVQLCGDAHLSNFGVFASPERQLIFDINDFDETLPGPWEWDVKRLAASFEIAGRDLGFSPDDRRDIVLAGVREYREQLREASRMRTLDAWYAHLDEEAIHEGITQAVRGKQLGKKEAREARQDMAKARTRDSVRVLARRAGKVEGELRIVRDPPLITPIEDLILSAEARERVEQSVRRLIARYRRTLAHDHHPIEEFRYVHMARKVVGVGSVGTRCWIFLMLGRDNSDPLFLQAKEARPSVLEAFAGRSRLHQHGERVVVGQRLMQAASDIFLGWLRVTDLDGQPRDYYIRQFHDWKGSAEIETMRVPGAMLYARMCGATLARAHARWGDRIAIGAYLGAGEVFDRAIAGFSTVYADQNERDYEALAQAVKSGRIPADMGL